MTLHFIGLGLHDEKDISLKGLEVIKKCSKVYLENYTSILNCSKEELEQLYGKEIILADRKSVEIDSDNTILEEAKTQEVAFLVVGDPLCATTHVDLFMRARKNKIKCEVIHNSSIMSAVGTTGLQVYKFGKTTSIPFENENVETPYDVVKENQKMGLHTLLLLDLNPGEQKFMTVHDAIRYLLRVEIKRGEGIFKDGTVCIGLARIGGNDQVIKAGKASTLLKEDFGKPVHSLIVPGKLHFMEEDVLKVWE